MCNESTESAQVTSTAGVVLGVSAVSDYEYELRNGDAVIATGRIQLDASPSPGETMSLGSQQVLITDVLRLGRTPRLILSQS
jgi:hypothetical protein